MILGAKSSQVLNDIRPVAQTSLVIKSFKKLIKKDLLVKTDPLQFAQRAGLRVEDPTAT